MASDRKGAQQLSVGDDVKQGGLQPQSGLPMIPGSRVRVPPSPPTMLFGFPWGVSLWLRLRRYTSSGDGLLPGRLIRDTPEMWEMSVADQRYQAVLAVIEADMSRFSRSGHLASWAANSSSNNKPPARVNRATSALQPNGSNRPRHGRARRSPQEEPSAVHKHPECRAAVHTSGVDF